jgi:hypothetical protein
VKAWQEAPYLFVQNMQWHSVFDLFTAKLSADPQIDSEVRGREAASLVLGLAGGWLLAVGVPIGADALQRFLIVICSRADAIAPFVWPLGCTMQIGATLIVTLAGRTATARACVWGMCGYWLCACVGLLGTFVGESTTIVGSR